MEFNNFTTIIKEEVAKKSGEQYQVKINEVIKNNGILLTGLTLMMEDSNISPTIYLDEYYDAFLSGKMNVEEIVGDVLDTYERNKVNKSIDIGFFTNFELVKDKIIYKVINQDMNQELLMDVPYIPWNDLAIVFQCLVANEEYGNATIMIHHAHLTLWNTTIDEVYELAKRNTPRVYPYEIRNMKDMISEMMKLSESEKMELEESMNMPGYVPMYVLTNQSKLQGASTLFYPNILKDFASAANTNVYILPSSIHEVLLLPEEGDENIEYLRQMVKEVNETQLQTEEILSNEIYYYSLETEQLSLL